MLLDECSDAGVEIKTKCQVEFIETLDESDEQRYILRSNAGVFTCHSLVIATGGLSIPTLGSSGFGYDIAEQFNLPLKERSA